MKNVVWGLLLALSVSSAAAQDVPVAAFHADFVAGQQAEEAQNWEMAEANYALCLKKAPKDTTVLKNHAYAAANSLDRHARKPEAVGQRDYLPLVVSDYDALVAAGQVRYLLDKAVAYATRAEASAATEASQLRQQALAAVDEYEHRARPTSRSSEVRKAVLAIQ